MRALLALGLALVLAPAAQAQSLVQERAVSGKGVETCLRPTGIPGGLAHWRPRGFELLDGATPVERVRLGFIGGCPEVAVAPGGAAVAAASAGANGGMRAVARDPGGAFGKAQRLRAGGGFEEADAAAVSPAGHAIVAWLQFRRDGDARLLVARRAPGGAFGRPEALTPWFDHDLLSPLGVTAAVDASGVATVAWLGRTTLEVATAAPGARFAVERFAVAGDATPPALAIAPDGWALLAHGGERGVQVLERPPGAARFARAASLPAGEAEYVVAAVRSGGGGLVAWRSGWFAPRAGVQAVLREASGSFGEPREVAAETEVRAGSFANFVAGVVGGPPFDLANATLRAALAPDGRALLAWAASGPFGSAETARAALGSLGGGFAAPQALGGRLLHVNGAVPLFLADGRAAVAWTDNAGRSGGEYPSGRGTLHLSVEGAAEVARPAPPRLTVRMPAVQRLYRGQLPRGTVACDRPCEVRVRVAGDHAANTIVLDEAGTTAVRLPYPTTRWGSRLRVRVEATARGGTRLTRVTRPVRMVRRPTPPMPEPLDVTASWERGVVTVRWHTAVPARRGYFYVETPESARLVEGRGRTRFFIRMAEEERPAWARVRALPRDGRRGEPVQVPVG